MRSKQTNWTETLIAVGQTGFGIVLATAGIFILLLDLEHLASEARLNAPGRLSGYVLPEEFVDELHRISPMTY